MLIAEKRNALLDWSVRLALIAGCFAAAFLSFDVESAADVGAGAGVAGLSAF